MPDRQDTRPPPETAARRDAAVTAMLTAPATDWNALAATHPGFMPVPAHQPTCLAILDVAIPSEARRMLDLARAEFARREACFVGHPDPSVWPRVAAKLRREMRMDLLELVAADLPADRDPADADAVLLEALQAHDAAHRSFVAATDAADEVAVAQNGGDDSDEAMAPARAARDAANDVALETWRDLFRHGPGSINGLLALLRHVEQHHADHAGIEDEPDVFGYLVESAAALVQVGASPTSRDAAGPAPTLAANPSPTLVAMVAEWQALVRQINSDDVTDEEVGQLGQRNTLLQLAIYRFPAASVADLLAKVSVFEDEMRDAVRGLAPGEDAKDTLPGAAWLGLFRDFERLARATAPAGALVTSTSDPVFALIAAHRAAYAEWDRASAAWTGMVPGAPGFAEAQASADAIGTREIAVYEALFSAEPATLPGTLALAEYLGDAVRRTRVDAEPPDGELALRTVTAALRRIVLAGGAEISTASDPALAAYAASRRAEAEMAAFAENGEAETVWRARETRLAAAQVDTREAAWITVPTTYAGRRALVDYARFQVETFTGPSGKIDNPEDLIGDILDAFAAAIDAERFASTHPDAEAAALVDAIEREWAAWSDLGERDYHDRSPEAEIRCEASQSRRDALLDAADALPATSRAARHAKALAAAWGEYVSTWEAGKPRSDYGLFGRLVLDIDGALKSGASA